MKAIDTNFSMIYYGEFLTKQDKEGKLVQKLYSDKNFQFLTLLNNYKQASDYDTLKQGIYDLIQELPEYAQHCGGGGKSSRSSSLIQPALPAKEAASYPPKTIGDAIELLMGDGSLTAEDAEKLAQLAEGGDKRVRSIFGAYQALNDYEDLADSLMQLCGHKRGTRKQRLEAKKQQQAAYQPVVKQRGTIAPPNVQEYAPKISRPSEVSQPSSTAGMGMISLMKFGGGGGGNDSNAGGVPPQIQGFQLPQKQAEPSTQMSRNIRKPSSEDEQNQHNADDENLEIIDNPNESGTDTNEEEISSIIEF